MTFSVLVLILVCCSSVQGQEPVAGRGLQSCVPPALDLPEITGAFRLVFDASFNEMENSKSFYSLFHWNSADGQDSIYVGHRNRIGTSFPHEARTELQVRTNGALGKCRARTDLAANVLYRFEVTLYADGSGNITIKDVASWDCPAGEITAPRNNIAKQHYLGNSPLDSQGGFRRMKGGISGIQLTMLGTGTHPRDQYKFYNFPGQPYNDGFVVNFYARFDNLYSGLQEQTIFDFGNGSPSNNILCAQYLTTDRLACAVYDGSGVAHGLVTDAGTLIEGEMDSWEFGVDVGTGRFWIQKNGSEIKTVNQAVVLDNVFRSGQKFLHSHWAAPDRLDGVVLGLRLTKMQAS